MLPMRVAVLSGYAGPRPSMFAGGAGDIFGLGGGASLGRSNAEWYSEAKEEVAEFDDLVTRTRKIANKQVREDLARSYIGDPGDSDSGLYRRNSVAANVAEAEGFSPVNTLVFGQSRVQSRVQKLKDINSDFKSAVGGAEATWGSLPAPQTIETIKTIESTPGWVTPVVIGAIAVAALAAFGVFKGK